MPVRKLIVIDESIDKALSNIYNAALKLEGLQMLSCVNLVKNGVLEESIDSNKNKE